MMVDNTNPLKMRNIQLIKNDPNCEDVLYIIDEKSDISTLEIISDLIENCGGDVIGINKNDGVEFYKNEVNIKELTKELKIKLNLVLSNG